MTSFDRGLEATDYKIPLFRGVAGIHQRFRPCGSGRPGAAFDYAGMGHDARFHRGTGAVGCDLSSTPRQRGFIEEAAGVPKHRRHWSSTFKKLADMDANHASPGPDG